MTDLSYALTLRYATHYIFLLVGVLLGATIALGAIWFTHRLQRPENPFSSDRRRSSKDGGDGGSQPR